MLKPFHFKKMITQYTYQFPVPFSIYHRFLYSAAEDTPVVQDTEK